MGYFLSSKQLRRQSDFTAKEIAITGIFRTQSNIKDEAFLWNKLKAFSLWLWCLYRWLCTSLCLFLALLSLNLATGLPTIDTLNITSCNENDPPQKSRKLLDTKGINVKTYQWNMAQKTFMSAFLLTVPALTSNVRFDRFSIIPGTKSLVLF